MVFSGVCIPEIEAASRGDKRQKGREAPHTKETRQREGERDGRQTERIKDRHIDRVADGPRKREREQQGREIKPSR